MLFSNNFVVENKFVLRRSIEEILSLMRLNTIMVDSEAFSNINFSEDICVFSRIFTLGNIHFCCSVNAHVKNIHISKLLSLGFFYQLIYIFQVEIITAKVNHQAQRKLELQRQLEQRKPPKPWQDLKSSMHAPNTNELAWY